MLEKYLIFTNKSVREVIEHMDSINAKVVFIVDENRKLLGLFTNGDMRRYILQNGDLTQNITVAMNSTPIVFKSRHEASEAKKQKFMITYPIVGEDGELLDAIFDREGEECNIIRTTDLKDVPLVMMAGGKGTRLYPYTKILPKALIPIGEIAISERIINNFYQYGCEQVYMILNHKSNMIKSYYDDLEKEINIDYVVEDTFLGTGGGLKLLENVIDSTCIVTNCDILINDDLGCIYKAHKKEGNLITVVCAMKNITVPYGVVKTTSHGSITDFQEKPEFFFLVNTGVYIIEPEVIKELNENEFIHLPDIAKRNLDAGKKVGVFPISDKAWMDMGQFSEMESMIKKLGLS